VEDLRERLSNIDRRIAGTLPRRVLFVVWTEPLISIGRGTFIADALRRAGARSVVDTTAEWPRISLEEILRLQPEFLVFASAHAADMQHDIASLRARPGWRDLDALRRGNIVIVSDAINRPAPRMVDAVEQLARAFHSESFASGDRQSTSPVPISEEACACAH
jgi:ABC-type Fe3+-hydroxamate transport system substrate-binding protein